MYANIFHGLRETKKSPKWFEGTRPMVSQPCPMSKNEITMSVHKQNHVNLRRNIRLGDSMFCSFRNPIMQTEINDKP